MAKKLTFNVKFNANFCPCQHMHTFSSFLGGAERIGENIENGT
jgi:hypothetical protein